MCKPVTNIKNESGIILANSADVTPGWGTQPPPAASPTMEEIHPSNSDTCNHWLWMLFRGDSWEQHLLQVSSGWWAYASFSLSSASHAARDRPARTQTIERVFHKEQSTLGYAQGCQNMSRFPDWPAIIKLPYFRSVPDLQHHPASTNPPSPGRHDCRHI